MYESKDISRIVKEIYGSGVSSDVVDRYIDNYLPRVQYHNLLLNGNDIIEIEIIKNKEEVLQELMTKLYMILPSIYIKHISDDIINEDDVEIKNNKLLIKGKRYSKYLIDKVTSINATMGDLDSKRDIIDFEKDLGKYTLAIKQKVIISARPEDFIKCSEDTTGWRSCFRIEGEYHCSTNAFYTDIKFLVTYILSPSGKKIGRRWLHIDYDLPVVCNGKEYGTYGYDTIKKVRGYIQALINKDTWVRYINDTSINVRGCYCDTEYTVSYVKGNKSNDYSIYDYISEGINYEGFVGDGRWYDDSCICDECGDRSDIDDMIYVDSDDR